MSASTEGAVRSRVGGRAGVAVVFAVSLVVRIAWLLAYERPADTVYSDMSGYVHRARAALGGAPPDLCFPPGAHAVYAAEMAVFGTDGLVAMGWVQALLGALVAPFVLLVARRALRSDVAAFAVGLVVALWQPLISFGGYFSSEVPFAFFLAATAALVARWVGAEPASRGAAPVGTALLAGAAMGMAYLVRPPILLSAALLVVWALWRRLGARSVLAFLVPVVFAVAFGAARYHHYSGRVALVSDNGAVQSFFAWTDYRSLVGTIVRKDGTERVTRFMPPARTPEEGFSETFTFAGDNCDGPPLTAERNRVVAESSLGTLARRAARNVRHLVHGPELWPERREAKEGFRATLMDVWPPLVLFGLVPLLLAGVVVIARGAVGGTAGAGGAGAGTAPDGRQRVREATALHVITLVVASAAYTGEARYRVPYDPVFIVVAAVAVERAVAAARALRKAQIARRQERFRAWRRQRFHH